MRIRTALVGAVCVAGLVLSGCSGGPDGQPVAADAPAQNGSGDITNLSDALSALGQAGNPGEAGSSGNTGDSGHSGNSSDPTDLGDLAGALGALGSSSGGCSGGLGAMMSLSTLFLPILTGSTLTQQQVDDVFSHFSNPPDAIADDVATVHAAAEKAVGKSGQGVIDLVDSDSVNTALDHISDYMATQCGVNPTQ